MFSQMKPPKEDYQPKSVPYKAARGPGGAALFERDAEGAHLKDSLTKSDPHWALDIVYSRSIVIDTCVGHPFRNQLSETR